tara:strand:- start:447 stop:1547 length:1101 start_codon:yes stop_codon:yes gene_type:complete
MNGLLTIIFLTLFVVLHELGHFLAARKSGIAVTEFFVGFGPKIFSFKRNNTEYGIKALPIGGYVKIPGMDESEDISGYKNDELFHTSNWKTKLFISISGIIVNFISAWIIIFFIININGISEPTLEISSIGESVNNYSESPSQKAGLIPGDKIYEFNGINLETWDELVNLIEINPDKRIELKLIRNENIIITNTILETRTINSKATGYLGVSPLIVNRDLNILENISYTTKTEYLMTVAAIDGIFTLLSPANIKTLFGSYSGGSVPDEVRPLSPIGLAQAGSQIAAYGYTSFFSLLAFVNVFLAVFNSIPLIPLDGGRVLMSLIEGITGKKIPEKNLYPIALVVVAVFIFIGITAFYLDLTNPINL